MTPEERSVWDLCPWCADGHCDGCRPDVFWCVCESPKCLARLEDNGGTDDLESREGTSDAEG